MSRELYESALEGLPAPINGEADASACLHAAAVRLSKYRPPHEHASMLYTVMVGLCERWGRTIPGIAQEVEWVLGVRQNFTTPDADIWSVLEQETQGKNQRLKLPWPQACACARPLLPGSISVLAGKPGSGKSWAALHLTIECVLAGIQVTYIALEEHLPWHLRRALALLSGNTDVLDPERLHQTPELLDIVKKEHEQDIYRIEPRIDCMPGGKLLDVLAAVEKRIAADDRLVIVDPITVADPGSLRPWEADRQMMARLGGAVHKSKSSVLLLTHPKKSGSASAKPGAPTMDDLAGGASITRLASSVLWLEPCPRDFVGQWMTESGVVNTGQAHKRLRVLKSRNGPGEGRAFLCSFSRLKLVELGEDQS